MEPQAVARSGRTNVFDAVLLYVNNQYFFNAIEHLAVIVKLYALDDYLVGVRGASDNGSDQYNYQFYRFHNTD